MHSSNLHSLRTALNWQRDESAKKLVAGTDSGPDTGTASRVHDRVSRLWTEGLGQPPANAADAGSAGRHALECAHQSRVGKNLLAFNGERIWTLAAQPGTLGLFRTYSAARVTRSVHR